MNSVIFQYLDTKKSQLKTNISANKQITKIRVKMATEDPAKHEETRQRLLESLKREVKQIMEEAVMKKFIHADSSSITSVCGESPTLKMKFGWNASTNSGTNKICGYNVTGHCGKYVWIRIAILEKLLVKIVEDLKAHASQFYEPDALLADPGDGQIFIELLLSPTTQRPHIGTIKIKKEDNPAVAPVMAREHIESLHQNSLSTLLYGKNNVNVQPNEKCGPIPGYLSLHKNNEMLVLKWTPNTLMNGSNEKEKSLFWDHALTVNLSDVVYIHCHQQAGSAGVILIGQDGVQRPPIYFPTPGSLLSFLNCLENGLHPNGQLDPPLFSPRSRTLVLPRLRSTGETSAPTSPTKEFSNQDYVFRLVSGTKPEDIGESFLFLHFMLSISLQKKWKNLDPGNDQAKSLEYQKTSMKVLPRSLVLLDDFKNQPHPQHGCAHVRHLKTVRTHLLSLVIHETVEDHEEGHNFTDGLTLKTWNNLTINGQVKDRNKVQKYVYFGGIDSCIRKEAWPYLLNHYNFGSTPEEREQTDKDSNSNYRQILDDWRAVEAYIIQNDKDHEVDGVSMGSTGSRDEVYEQLEMISSGLEKIGNFEEKRGSIEEPSVEGLDEESKQRLMSGQDLHMTTNGDDVESGCCDCGEDINNDKMSHVILCRGCGKKFSTELNGNDTTLTNGHDMKSDDGGYIESHFRTSKDGMSDPESDDSSLCKQCSQDGSISSGPYSAELLENFGMNLHRIDKDVQRCDRNYWYFTPENLKKLRNVISSYVWKTLDIGYVQGMCDLVAPLLVVFDDEAKTYSCFVHLMQRMNKNFPHGSAMDLHFANMRSLIQVLDPEMFEHLQANGDLTHFYFCYRWFLLDFKRELLYEDIFTVWETIWAAEPCSTDHFVLFIALALLQFYRDIILDNKMDFTDIIKFFNEMAERHDAKAALQKARTLINKVQELIRNQ
ncbi:hypothetical protein QZH41_008338 [Actinostola sp. cb2023]|nr:hypothetical protein QZH41_008338 [Actinostola sp. cb2023]